MTDLVERVARAICEAFGADPDETTGYLRNSSTVYNEPAPQWECFHNLSRAAIRVVVEECARVAECQQDHERKTNEENVYNLGCRVAAKAIRALAKGDGG